MVGVVAVVTVGRTQLPVAPLDHGDVLGVLAALLGQTHRDAHPQQKKCHTGYRNETVKEERERGEVERDGGGQRLVSFGRATTQEQIFFTQYKYRPLPTHDDATNLHSADQKRPGVGPPPPPSSRTRQTPCFAMPTGP